MSSEDSLGDRMKGYEACWKFNFPNRLPVILRIDGKAFHTYTRGCDKPFDMNLIHVMDDTAIKLCEKIQGAVFAYVQSDEISILVYPWRDTNSQAWFDNELIKMVSVSAGIASARFTACSSYIFGEPKEAVFDSRAFVIPEHDINNYFIWRQKDWERNSIQLLARSIYSHKELDGKGHEALHDLLHAKNVNWNDLAVNLKRGRGIKKESYIGNENSLRSRWVVDNNIPVFTQNREYIQELLPKHDPA